MNILNVQGLRKSFGTRTVFSGVDFAVDEGEKVGFVGANGSGKSTLFRIMAGAEGSGGGTIALRRGARVGYLAQEPGFGENATITQAVAEGHPELHRALGAFHQLSEQLAHAAPSDAGALLARQAKLGAEIDVLDGWSWQHRMETMLTRLGVGEWSRRVEGLSGGERKRVALARVLLGRPDLLLLDEPTNHLDADTTLWLEEYLQQQSAAVMLITHDRYFLDRVVSRMIEVSTGELTAFPGGYTEYLEAKSERTERLAVEEQKRQRLIEQELAWVKRSPSARTGKQQARINRLAGLQTDHDELRLPSRNAAEIRFGDVARLGRTVLDLHHIRLAYDDRVLIRDLSTRLSAGERVGIIGPNGAGKTSLLRIVLGEQIPDAGEVVVGRNTRTAYFDQQRTDLDLEASVYEAAADQDWVELGGERVHLRSYLERFLFPVPVQRQKVRSLSGGERNRLLLARLFLQDANLLILDEPTNDLDLTTLQVLESVLTDYPGCVLLVTHDRFFLDKVATGLLVFEGGGVVRRHEGGYDLYRRLREQREAERVEQTRASARTAAPAVAPPKADAPRRLSYREQQELGAIEAQIIEAETERDALASRLSDPALYADTPDQVAEVSTAFAAANARVDALYARWGELEEIRAARA